jgi:hypothetical protein
MPMPEVGRAQATLRIYDIRIQLAMRRRDAELNALHADAFPRDQLGAWTQAKPGERSRLGARGVRRLKRFARLRARPRSIHVRRV